MPQVTINVSDNVFQWLQQEAALSGSTIEQIVERQLLSAHTASQALSWQEQDIIDIMRQLNARPDVMIPVQTIFHHWSQTGRNNQDMVTAIQSLVAKGAMSVNQAQTDCALTNAGYALL
jgi:hypothetical protein